MTESETAEASTQQEARTGLPGAGSRADRSLRRRLARRRDGARRASDRAPSVRLVGDRTAPDGSETPAEAPVLRSVDTGSANTGSANSPLADVVCPTCEVDFDTFSGSAEAAYFALIHNGLHHGTRPVALVSPSGGVAGYPTGPGSASSPECSGDCSVSAAPGSVGPAASY